MKLLDVDLDRLSVRVCGRAIPVVGLQLRLLVYLWRNQNHVLTRDQILDKVWGNGSEAGPKVVDVHVCRLRKRLEEAGVLLEAVRLYGYCLNTEKATALPAPQPRSQRSRTAGKTRKRSARARRSGN